MKAYRRIHQHVTRPSLFAWPYYKESEPACVNVRGMEAKDQIATVVQYGYPMVIKELEEQQEDDITAAMSFMAFAKTRRAQINATFMGELSSTSWMHAFTEIYGMLSNEQKAKLK